MLYPKAINKALCTLSLFLAIEVFLDFDICKVMNGLIAKMCQSYSHIISDIFDIGQKRISIISEYKIQFVCSCKNICDIPHTTQHRLI